MDDATLLEGLIDVMERKDHELRMVSVRLPPYNTVAGRGMERIKNLTIEEDFVSDLRMSTLDDISDRLNSSDAVVRVRPAADTVCLISLIDHATKRTWFRKELRMLRIAHSLEEFFRSTTTSKRREFKRRISSMCVSGGCSPTCLLTKAPRSSSAVLR